MKKTGFGVRSHMPILFRFLQYGAAALTFGPALFFLYSPLLKGIAPPDWTKTLTLGGGILLAVATPVAFIAQLAEMSGSLTDAFAPDTIRFSLLNLPLGQAALAREACALLALVACLILPAGRALWWVLTIVGAAAAASLAWSGHGAANEGVQGAIHLGGDIVHILAAAAWIGALGVFACAVRANSSVSMSNLHAALAGFSGAGSLFVALIVVSGLVNEAFLAGWDARAILATPYGQVLSVKLALFFLMLLLAANNRFRLTRALARNGETSLPRLRASIAIETAAGFAILAAVAWLGTLPPVLELNG